MITRERRAREADEKALAEVLQHAQEERLRIAEERRVLAESRYLMAETRRVIAESRRAVAEEERRRADEERARLLAEIDWLTRLLDGMGDGQAEN